ncbi:MAG TPA: hypothetical protein VHI52_19520 [Verrucomicrobiae bacterium]|nr:hypothetical protein [Verrucomicrobiae bacterium]
MATKEHRTQARLLLEHLESRLHTGAPIADAELLSVSEFLRQKDFSAASDYHTRLGRVRHQLTLRSRQTVGRHGKRNYGGQAGDRWMQLQSAFDHIILSTCYAGEFNTRRGRIKISHRFNREGRVEFVELKFVNSLHPVLNGQLRKLLLVEGYQTLRKDWKGAEAFVLPVLPQELVFLYENIFRCPKHEMYAWLINIGHGIIQDLADTLRRSFEPDPEPSSASGQLPLAAIRDDEVACPIIDKAAVLQSTVQCLEPSRVLVRY